MCCHWGNTLNSEHWLRALTLCWHQHWCWTLTLNIEIEHSQWMLTSIVKTVHWQRVLTLADDTERSGWGLCVWGQWGVSLSKGIECWGCSHWGWTLSIDCWHWVWNWALTLGVGIECCQWEWTLNVDSQCKDIEHWHSMLVLSMGIYSRHWVVDIGCWHWNLTVSVDIECWHGVEDIECWHWPFSLAFALSTDTECWHWVLALGVGIGCGRHVDWS